MRAAAAAIACACAAIAGAQQISGSLPPGLAKHGQRLVLQRTEGAAHFPVDSARVSPAGAFRFARKQWPTGYYRLGLGEDRVDLILNPREAAVVLRFDGAPLRDHLTVVQSDENRLLWENKYASRDALTQQRRIAEQRRHLGPTDADALIRLAAQEDSVQARLQATIDRLLRRHPGSFFAKAVRTDRAVLAAMPHGPQAIRDSMDWRDPALVRSSVYPRAIMAILQSATPALPHVLKNASDSILAWASPDTLCWSFARRQLIDLFATYGPEEAVQHLVDRYVTGPQSLSPPDRRLLALVAEQLKASIGSPAPDAELPSPITGSTDRLHDLLQTHPYTLLFFYSSTCDHCHEQMAPLNALHLRYARKGLQILGIALDASEEEFRSNIAERQLAFACYSELNGWGSAAAKAFAVRATPWLVLIGRDGRIVAKPRDAAELESLLPDLLP
ncbi:MAG: TlpA family protein disulfide reductase [Flavobacteriales bacterium]